jgi:hypothetical protein
MHAARRKYTQRSMRAMSRLAELVPGIHNLAPRVSFGGCDVNAMIMSAKFGFYAI